MSFYYDIRRDQPLYDEKLTVQCTSAPTTSSSSPLTALHSTSSTIMEENYDMRINLKILHGYRGYNNGNQQEKILYFEITDENDFYFLYTLEIGENDFHNLKKDQRLIVDFSGFSKKFIDLIQLCLHTSGNNNKPMHPPLTTSHSHSNSGSNNNNNNHNGTSSPHSDHFFPFQAPQYFAKMDFTTSIFSIIEMNEFNHVIHLCLQFRPGNDNSIKSYLASTLKLSLARYELLKHDFENCNEECLSLKRLNREQATDLRTIRETTDREIHLLATNHSQELMVQHQQHLEQMETLRQRWDNEMMELKESHEKTLRELSLKLSTLERNYSELSRERLELEYSLKQQSAELEKLQPECLFYKNSLSELQEVMRTKDREHYRLEQELARSTARREAMELQISDKEEIVEKSTSLRNASEQSRQDALKQVEVYSTALSALQEKFKTAVNEIHKGNETLRRQQVENQTLKEKLNSKNEIIRKQENMIQEQKDHLSDLNRKNLSLEENIDLLNQKKGLLERELTESKKQVVESAKLIQDNEQVINHLNELLTDFQLGGTGRGLSTPGQGRYATGGSYNTPIVAQPYERGGTSTHMTHTDPLIESEYHDHPHHYPNPHSHHHHQINYDDEKYHPSATLPTPTPPYPTPLTNYHPTSSSRNTTIPYNRTPPSQRKESTDYLFNERRNEKKDVEFDLLLTPNHLHTSGGTSRNIQPGGGNIAGSNGVTKGYYDGLLDIPVVPSAALSSSATRPAGITPSRDNERIGGKSSGKKPVYSWSLPGFGREDEEVGPTSTPLVRE